ncbi:hypothetical protein ACLOJK_006493 [Asimina triloba]
MSAPITVDHRSTIIWCSTISHGASMVAHLSQAADGTSSTIRSRSPILHGSSKASGPPISRTNQQQLKQWPPLQQLRQAETHQPPPFR